MREKTLSAAFWTWSLTAEEVTPVAVAITLSKDFEATFTDEAAVQQLDAGLQEDICAALGVDLAAVSVLCHQRGSIIAEVALRGSGDGRDARSAASLSAELVSQVKDCSSALRSRPIFSHDDFARDTRVARAVHREGHCRIGHQTLLAWCRSRCALR